MYVVSDIGLNGRLYNIDVSGPSNPAKWCLLYTTYLEMKLTDWSIRGNRPEITLLTSSVNILLQAYIFIGFYSKCQRSPNAYKENAVG